MTMIRAMRARVAERIKGMDVNELAAGQVPGALTRLFELEWKALGMEDNLNLKHEGKIEVEAAADTAWLMDYLRSLPERANDKPEGEGNADRTSDSAPDAGGSYLAGRGAGKTRAAAEWIRKRVVDGGAKRIALVGRTTPDVRQIMIEGESGLLNVFPPSQRPVWAAIQGYLF